MSTHSATHPHDETESGVFFKVATLLLGLGVAVVSLFALGLWADARTEPAAASEPVAAASSHDHATDHNTALPLESFAGVVPENAAELAKAHEPYDATLPPIPAGDVAKVTMVMKDRVVEVAPGVEYNVWAFDEGAPGPIVHVREGQTVEFTLKNGGSIPHSMDFHAARIAPNVAFKDIAPGESFTFRFKAGDPGVYMYHCGTKPVLAHIATGMHGAIG